VRDLSRTYPSHVYYQQRQGPGQRSLFNVLRAYSVYDRQVPPKAPRRLMSWPAAGCSSPRFQQQGCLWAARGAVPWVRAWSPAQQVPAGQSLWQGVQSAPGPAVRSEHVCAPAAPAVTAAAPRAGAGGLRAGHGLHRGPAAPVHVRGGRVLDDDGPAEGRAACAAGGPLPAGPAAAAAVPVPVLGARRPRGAPAGRGRGRAWAQALCLARDEGVCWLWQAPACALTVPSCSRSAARRVMLSGSGRGVDLVGQPCTLICCAGGAEQCGNPCAGLPVLSCSAVACLEPERANTETGRGKARARRQQGCGSER